MSLRGDNDGRSGDLRQNSGTQNSEQKEREKEKGRKLSHISYWQVELRIDKYKREQAVRSLWDCVDDRKLVLD